MRVITGTGRSGAAVIAQLLHCCGYDVGHPNFPRDLIASEHLDREPMESALITALNGDMITGIRQAGSFFPDTVLAKRLAEEYQDRVDQIPFDFVKDCRFSITLPIWWYAGKVEFVLVCIRNLHDAVRSCVANQGAGGIYSPPLYLAGEGSFSQRAFWEFAGRLGHLVSFLKLRDVPHSFVRYSRLVEDPQELVRAFPELRKTVGLKKFKKIHGKIARPEFVDFDEE